VVVTGNSSESYWFIRQRRCSYEVFSGISRRRSVWWRDCNVVY